MVPLSQSAYATLAQLPSSAHIHAVLPGQVAYIRGIPHAMTSARSLVRWTVLNRAG